MNEYTRYFFGGIVPQITNAVESEGTYNIIAANAAVNPNFKQTTGGIARYIMSQKTDLIGMTDNEIEKDPYKATAKFLKHSIADVSVRVFNNTFDQLQKQGMDESSAFKVAERMASTTAKNLIQPLYSKTFEEQRQGVDNLISIMTKPNTDNGKIEIDLNRIYAGLNEQKPINTDIAFKAGDKTYNVKPIQDGYTPFISKDIDLGGEWGEGFIKGLGALGSNTLLGQAVTGTMEAFDIDANEWLGARREFERNVMSGDHGSLYGGLYTGRDMAGVIGDTIAISAATGGYFSPVLQTPLRSAMNEWIEESGQLGMQYVTGDERLKSNSTALWSNIAFDTVTMGASINAGKVLESAFQSAMFSKALPKFLTNTANGTIMRNAMRTTADLSLDTLIDLSMYNAMDANNDDESILTQNTRNMYEGISKLPDFSDPQYIDALGSFIGRKMAGRFIGGVIGQYRSDDKGPYFDTSDYNVEVLKMNKLQKWINRTIAPPSTWRAVDNTIRNLEFKEGMSALPGNLKTYIESGASFKDLFKLYLDHEYQQSAIFKSLGLHDKIFGKGKVFDTTTVFSNLNEVISKYDDIYTAINTPNLTDANLINVAQKSSDAMLKDINEYKFPKEEPKPAEAGTAPVKPATTEPDQKEIVIASLIAKHLKLSESVFKDLKDDERKTLRNTVTKYFKTKLKSKGLEHITKTANDVIDKIERHENNNELYPIYKQIHGMPEVNDPDMQTRQQYADMVITEDKLQKQRVVRIPDEVGQYKLVDIDSDDYKNYVVETASKLKANGILSGLGLYDPKEYETLKTAFKEVEAVATEIVKNKELTSAKDLLDKIRPTMAEAAKIVANRYKDNILNAQDTVGADGGVLTKAHAYANNIAKLNNLSATLGDVMFDEIVKIKKELRSKAGLVEEIGTALSKVSYFKDAYDRSIAKHGDNDIAKAMTFDEVFNQMEDNALYLTMKRTDMNKLHQGYGDNKTKMNDVIDYQYLIAGFTGYGETKVMTTLLSRTAGFRNFRQLIAEDIDGQVSFNPMKMAYANKYMQNYLFSNNTSSDVYNGTDIEIVVKAVALKFMQAQSQVSKQMLMKLQTVLDSHDIILDMSKIYIDNNGKLIMESGLLKPKTNVENADVPTLIRNRMQQGAREILDEIEPMYFKADFTDNSHDTYFMAAPTGTLYATGKNRYTYDEVYSMFSEGASKEYDYNLKDVLRDVIRTANTGTDAIEHTAIVLSKMNPKLYESMTKTKEKAVLFNKFVASLVTEEYVKREHIASLDIKNQKIIMKAQMTGSGQYSFYEGKHIFSINKKTEDKTVREFLEYSADQLRARGWIKLFSKGAADKEFYMRLPVKGNSLADKNILSKNTEMGYRLMVDKFKNEMSNFPDSELNKKIIATLENIDYTKKKGPQYIQNLYDIRDLIVAELKSKIGTYSQIVHKPLEGSPIETEAERMAAESILKTEMVMPTTADVKGKSVRSDFDDTLEKQIKTLEAFNIKGTNDLMQTVYTYSHYGFGAMIADLFAKRAGGLGCFGDPNEKVSAYKNYLDSLESKGHNFKIAIIPSQFAEYTKGEKFQIDDGADYLKGAILDVIDKIYGEGGKAVINPDGSLIKVQSNRLSSNIVMDNIFKSDEYLNYDNVSFGLNVKIITPAMFELFTKSMITKPSGIEIVELTGKDAKWFLEQRFLHSIRNPEVKDVKDSNQLGTFDSVSRKYSNISELKKIRSIQRKISALKNKQDSDFVDATDSLMKQLTEEPTTTGQSLVVDKWDVKGYGAIKSYKISDPSDVKVKTMTGEDTYVNMSSVGALSDRTISGLLAKEIGKWRNDKSTLSYDTVTDHDRFTDFANSYIDMVTKGTYTQYDITKLEKQYEQEGYTLKTILDVISTGDNTVLFKEGNQYYFLASRFPLISEGAKAALLMTHIVPYSSRIYLSGTHILTGQLDFDGDPGSISSNSYLKKLYKDYYNYITEDKDNVKSFDELGLGSVIEIVNNHFSRLARNTSDMVFEKMEPADYNRLKDNITEDIGLLFSIMVSNTRKAAEFSQLKLSDYDDLSIALENTFAKKKMTAGLSDTQQKLHDRLSEYRITKANENQYGILEIHSHNVKGIGGTDKIEFSNPINIAGQKYKFGVSNIGYDKDKKHMFLLQADNGGIGYKIVRHGIINGTGDNGMLANNILYKMDNTENLDAFDTKIVSEFNPAEYNESKDFFNNGKYRLASVSSVNRQIYRAGTENVKTRELDKLSLEIPDATNRKTYIINLVESSYANNFAEFDGIIKTDNGTDRPRINSYRLTNAQAREIRAAYGTDETKYNKFLKSVKELNEKYSYENIIPMLQHELFSTPKTKQIATKNIEDTSAQVKPAIEQPAYKWARTSDNSYEVSSEGDKRFSALFAKLNDGRTIEEAYQLDIKGYRTKGNDWKLGKGKPPINKITKEQAWDAYKGLWKTYLSENPSYLNDLIDKAKGKTLTDKFATTDISQARALSELLNELTAKKITIEPVEVPEVVTPTKDGGMDYTEYEVIARMFDEANKLSAETVYDNIALLDKFMPKYIKKLGLDNEDDEYNESAINQYPPVIIRAAIVYKQLKDTDAWDDYREIADQKYYVGKINESDTEHEGAVLIKNNLPVKIKYELEKKVTRTGKDGETETDIVTEEKESIYAIHALNKLNRAIIDMTGNVPMEFKTTINNFFNMINKPITLSSRRYTSDDKLYTQLALIHNNNKVNKLFSITDNDAKEYLKSLGVTEIYRTGNEVRFKTTEGDLTIEKLFATINNKFYEYEKQKPSADIQKDTELVRKQIMDRNMAQALVAMFGGPERRAMYFRSIGIDTVVARNLIKNIDDTKGTPRIDYHTLKQYAMNHIGMSYKLSQDDIPMLDYKIIMENCK